MLRLAISGSGCGKLRRIQQFAYKVEYQRFGTINDLCLMAAPAIYMNRYACFDYASYVLRLPKKQDNILRRCLFVLMTSVEIISPQSRLSAILYISFRLPMRWLAAKTPELGQWGWGPISNGNAIDTFPEKMMDIVNDPTKILDEDFMMSMFSKYLDMLPPFRRRPPQSNCPPETVL